MGCQRGPVLRCKSVSITYVEPVVGEISRAGDEFVFDRFHLGLCFLADELDGNLGVFSVGELPELSQ